jgi:hypothetical protein
MKRKTTGRRETRSNGREKRVTKESKGSNGREANLECKNKTESNEEKHK